ncbi:MAG: CARDB domain-containing protein [Pirellulaceae bacterium]
MKLETPHIEVVLNGPADLPVGAPAQYDVVVYNRDSINLEGLILRLDVPPGVAADAQPPSRGEIEVEQADGATLFTWAFDSLPAGQSAKAPIKMIAQSPRKFAVAMEWTLMPVSGAATIDVRSPRLELALEGPSDVRYGEANTYRLHVRNPGNAAAQNVAVKLSAEPYGASSTEIGSIPAGSEETIDVELTFNQRGTIGMAASATALGDLTSATQIDVLVKQPNLVATIEAPQAVYHGTATNYQVTVANTGDAEARDITATFVLPPGAKLISSPAGSTLSGGKLMWPIAEIRPGMTAEAALQLTLAREGANRVDLECSMAVGLAANCSTTTDVRAIADLKLIVGDPIAPAPVGSEVVYELQLTNRGSKAANNVKIVAQFSDGIEPTRGEGHAFRIVPGQLLFEPIARVEAGQTITLRVIALAETSGTHRFRAEVRSDDSQLKLVQEESTQYLDSIGRIASPPLSGSTLR